MAAHTTFISGCPKLSKYDNVKLVSTPKIKGWFVSLVLLFVILLEEQNHDARFFKRREQPVETSCCHTITTICQHQLGMTKATIPVFEVWIPQESAPAIH
jgi:hypothetical protein